MRQPAIALFLVLWFLGMAPGSRAQVSGTGAILGTVTDSAGAVVPEASVTVRNVETGVTRTVNTDATGRYSARQLGLGSYEVGVERAGFQSVLRSGITLTVGREAVIDFTLQVGAVAERITVTGEAPLIETTNATVASLVDQRTIRDLPLNGRSFTDLTAIQPGAVPVTTVLATARTGGGRKISISGARPSQSLYLLDGVENMNPAGNSPLASVLSETLGVDAVREYSVLTNNFGAQYSRAIGGVVNAATRSGANEFHGSLLEFLRNSSLDAKNYFDPKDEPIPPFKQNQFGATLGGPIQKDRTFFFVTYEGLRRRTASRDFLRVIDDDARRGIITDAAGNVTSTVTVNPAMVPVMALSVRPNGERLGDGTARYAGSRILPSREDFGMARIDYNLSSNDTLFGRFTGDGSEALTGNHGLIPGFSETESGRYISASAQYTRIISPSLLNTLSVGYVRSQMRGDKGFPPEILDPRMSCIPQDARFPVCGGFIPGGTAAGITGFVGTSPTFDFRQADNVFQYQDQVTLTTSGHTITLGGDIKRYRMNDTLHTWPHGTLAFQNLTAFLQGRPRRITAVLPQSENPFVPPDLGRGYRQTFGSAFVQDDFRVLPNLTVNLGLRWEDMSDPSEVNGKIGTVRDVLRESDFTLGKLFEASDPWKGLAPRFGFAWTPLAGQQTVLRGGFGVYKEWPLTYLYQLSNYVPPFADRIQIENPAFPFPLSGVTTGQRDPLINANDWIVGSAYQYNLGIEQQLGSNYAVRLGYVGTRSRHLLTVHNPIQPVPQQDENGRWYTPGILQLVNPHFFSMRYSDTSGNAWYNSLQAVLERKFSAGLQYRVSYTLSRNLDSSEIGSQNSDSTGNFTIMNSYNLAAEKGLSILHSKSNLVGSFGYELPFGSGKTIGGGLTGLANHLAGGWQVNGVFSLRSGLVRNISMVDCSGTRSASPQDRPDLAPGRSNNPVLGDPAMYFDPTAFVMPPSCWTAPTTANPSGQRGYFGNLGRNTLILPGLIGTDVSLFKNIALGEERSLQFRAEFFNIANHPNYGPPNTQIFSSAAGARTPGAGEISTTATSARQIQFALKLLF